MIEQSRYSPEELRIAQQVITDAAMTRSDIPFGIVGKVLGGIAGDLNEIRESGLTQSYTKDQLGVAVAVAETYLGEPGVIDENTDRDTFLDADKLREVLIAHREAGWKTAYLSLE